MQDYNSNGFHRWPFLSVQMWGEDPRGVWTLMVESVSANNKIGGWFLVFEFSSVFISPYFVLKQFNLKYLLAPSD